MAGKEQSLPTSKDLEHEPHHGSTLHFSVLVTSSVSRLINIDKVCAHLKTIATGTGYSVGDNE